MRALGARLGREFRVGDVVALIGELGAGKTTLVRGVLESYGLAEPVRSPTFNLIQVFDVDPPVMHADLYRLTRAEGVGLEEYFDSHVCLIEWPDRADGILPRDGRWEIRISFDEPGRLVHVHRPDLT